MGDDVTIYLHLLHMLHDILKIDITRQYICNKNFALLDWLVFFSVAHFCHNALTTQATLTIFNHVASKAL